MYWQSAFLILQCGKGDENIQHLGERPAGAQNLSDSQSLT